MLDKKGLRILGGTGGRGVVSFLRERSRPFGGPDGGDGGAGGPVIVEAVSHLRALDHLEPLTVVYGQDGSAGSGRDRTGKSGKPLIIRVPVGTQVSKVTESDVRELVADLVVSGSQAVVAKGGFGGRGNHRFARPTNQEPLLAEGGGKGEEATVLLEVKLLADAAFVGAPNAGKSTLLSKISRAKPKIGNYPFTTLEPVLGVVEWKGQGLICLDIPGLIEDAHLGKGLGLEFLKHTERVRTLVQLVDGESNDLVAEYHQVAKELELFAGGLEDKERVTIVTKMDLPEAKARFAAQQDELKVETGADPIPISAVTGEGIELMLDSLLRTVANYGELDDPEPVKRLKPTPLERVRKSAMSVKREGDAFIVECQDAELVAEVVDLENWKARMQYHRLLKRLGILRALEGKGVETGDTVKFGKVSMEWE